MNLLLVYPGRAAKRMLGPQGKRKLGLPPPILNIDCVDYKRGYLTPPLLLKYLYHSMKVGGHVFVLGCIDFASFYDISIGFWNCSESVVIFCF
jgi:hypothetical protein